MAVPPLAWLESRGAQRDVLDGLRAIAGDWATLWRECPRGDWLLGIACRLDVDHRALVRAAALSARTSLDDFEGPEAGRVLDLADAWSRGEAAGEEVAAATRALDAAITEVVDPRAGAAGRAAQAVGLGVVDRDVLASAPAFAAEATIVSTLDCGLELAMRAAHGACADAVRKAIPWSDVEAAVERLQ
ncbi:MAG: hypothetical protein KF819_13635 [Labilithrix sp.]|nr:hypothetical protein [Labilithrix sp.]